jgi:signal transduction histidine kinase
MSSNAISKLQDRLADVERSLERSQQLATAGQFAVEIMHEINNPLDALANLTYLARVEADDPDKVREYMQLAEAQLVAVTGIAKQTLSFSKRTEAAQAIDLTPLAEAALVIHHRAICAKHLKLVKDLPKGHIAQAHPGEMLQVISNLVLNALDALPVEGTLCLRLRKGPTEVHLIVADNGHGIPQNILSRIFDPFFTTKQGKGTGLGLAISKTIVERHRGRINSWSSVRPGKSGTAFRISLPC